MAAKRIIATLHPKEVYSDAEISTLEAIADRDPLLEVRMGEMERLLPACDCVVTQNSSAAFNGYFFGVYDPVRQDRLSPHRPARR